MPASLRARFTLAASLIMGCILVMGATGFYLVLQHALLEGVRSAADMDADDLEARLGSLPGITETDDERFFHVVSASGEVVAESNSAPGMLLGIPDSGDELIIRVPEENIDFLVTVEDTDDGHTIMVGRSLEDLHETLFTVAGLLAGIVPVLALIVAVVTWIVVGRALTPVDRLRREVEEVTAHNLHRRVEDPGHSDEIGRLASTMNHMLERLNQSQRAQRQFISDASHELKSPLASLRQYAEVARAHPGRVSAADLSGAMLNEGGRLERLVSGMLVLARADEQSLRASSREVDLDDLVLAEARRLRQSTPLTIATTGVGAARVHGDAALLGQGIRNLIDNAAQHAVDRLNLHLSTNEVGVIFAVEDDGPGIPKEDRHRVFDRFVRLDQSRTRNAGGSGLGLSIVQEIIHTHSGTIRITDSTLGGTRVEVQLPATL
ncbi:hypothetical protein AC792_12675 [Arthrobacter sp. RIT-PI-e]|uniref:sensor histidine kinase n=1 Tax=Arthrobacter sp. RIT-PI-e TaxID=1681197 RepID=UPI000676A1E5|nr:ATP-binding protein [Arthrobacter sp. RIT-PI-e]KNC18343.1 hypothetical protein AC792_12675 [Arthrobacter sp. RIT-PI-e]